MKENRRQNRNYLKDRKMWSIFFHIWRFLSHFYETWAVWEHQNTTIAQRIAGLSAGPCLPGSGKSCSFITTIKTPLSSQSVLLAKTGGRGGNSGVGDVPETDTAGFSFLPIPFNSQKILAGLAQNRGPGTVRERGMGLRIKGNHPWPKGV